MSDAMNFPSDKRSKSLDIPEMQRRSSMDSVKSMDSQRSSFDGGRPSSLDIGNVGDIRKTWMSRFTTKPGMASDPMLDSIIYSPSA